MENTLIYFSGWRSPNDQVHTKKILVINSDHQECAAMEENLQRLGFVSCVVDNYENFEQKLFSYKPDFIILEKSLELVGPSVIYKVRSTQAF